MFIKNLFLFLKEILIILFIQYSIIILSILFLGFDSSIVWGTIFLTMFDIIYIIWRSKILNVSFNFKISSFPYILLGTSISIIYNMILFKYNLYSYSEVNIPLIINVISSAIIGPIFEEVLFRCSFISKLEKFISSNIVIILLSSFIFSISHTNIFSMIIAFIVGIVNSYIYVKKRDFSSICLFHIFVNLVSCFLCSYNIYILVLGTILFVISLLLIYSEE